MDTALPQKFPFILDRNLEKANFTENWVCTYCDIVVLDLNQINLNILQLLHIILCWILVPPVTKLFRSNWLHFFFQCFHLIWMPVNAMAVSS